MDEIGKSFSLRYVGARFENARLPLDVLSDLPALRDLIAALAKLDFRNTHPDRKRVPQGFGKSISFSLSRIKEGSAVLVLELENEIAQQNLPNIGDGMEEIVERAYKNVATIFDDAANDKYPDVLPLDAIRALSKLGANIQENEHIELLGTRGADGNVVCLDSYRRKNLLTRVHETYTIDFKDIGELTGIDTSRNVIQIETQAFGEIRLPLDGVKCADDFNGALHFPIEFAISIALDAHDEFKRLEEVHSVDLVKPYDKDMTRCISKLQEISKLKHGWLGDGEGEQLVHLAGVRANQLIFMRADLAKFFRIFPTEDGGISIEFDKNDWSFAVEILPDGTLELDGSSRNGDFFELQEFEDISKEFLAAFDKMISVVFNNET